MLRSVGVPARMAVGFAEGAFDSEANVYIVRSFNAHAWPEVYFPGIGWIEFEPTGNQNPLLRPNRPEDSQTPESAGQAGGLRNPLGQDSLQDFNNRGLQEFAGPGVLPTTVTEQFIPNTIIYAIIAITLLVVFWLMNCRYAFVERIPVRLQIAYERNGGRSPAWLANWARWATLTPIERSFETVNRSLRLLGETPAFFATPVERAKSLVKKLPVAASDIETLLEQHQASLFTPDPGHVGIARRASLNIWFHTIQSIIRKFLYGRPIE